MTVAEILEKIIDGRDTSSMKVSEAKKIISEFWMNIELKTFYLKDRRHLDYACNKALKKYSLDLI